MPSRADEARSSAVRARVALEVALRAAALLLALIAVRVLSVPRPPAARTVSGSSLAGMWPQLIAQQGGTVHVTFGALPAAPERDLLAALSRAGTRVTWSAPNASPLAVSVERLREPSAPVRVALVSNGAVEVSDDAGALDTVSTGSGVVVAANPAAAVVVRSLSGRRGQAATEEAAANARIAVPPVAVLKPVLVLARAHWESKFVVAALEESGWRVATRISVAPGLVVAQEAKAGSSTPAPQVSAATPAVFDSSHFGAVIVLDSGQVANNGSLKRFVLAGGGVVLGPAAARDPALRSLRIDGASGAVSARRMGAGRVEQIGDSATWRQRLGDNDNGVGRHRAWWTRIVAGVMPTVSAAAYARTDDAAPLAQLVQSLGPASAVGTPARAWSAISWLLPFLLLILLAEWASRRRRGAS